MPLETPYAPVQQRVDELNRKFRGGDAIEVLRHGLSTPEIGNVALVSSFGAEAVVLLHLISRIDPATPVIFIDTEMLFPETLAYQRKLATEFKLTDVRVTKATRKDVFLRDNENLLQLHDKDACCTLRKTEPLQKALNDFDGWISGRKRFQSGSRATMEFFENEDDRRIKINPLAHWSREDVAHYITGNDLPRHPLVAIGYPSIGCAPCTTPVGAHEDVRAGRWRGENKIECGIHFGADGTVSPERKIA